MNTETGRIYHGTAEIEAALARDERLIRIGAQERLRLEAMAPDARVEWAKALPSRQQRRRALRQIGKRGGPK